VVLQFEMRGALYSHRATDVGVRLCHLFFAESQRRQKIKARALYLFGLQTKRALTKIIADRETIEDEGKLECTRQQRLDPLDHLVAETFRSQRGGIDVRAADQCARSPAITNDL